jgi:hypothetical protein
MIAKEEGGITFVIIVSFFNDEFEKFLTLDRSKIISN